MIPRSSKPHKQIRSTGARSPSTSRWHGWTPALDESQDSHNAVMHLFMQTRSSIANGIKCRCQDEVRAGAAPLLAQGPHLRRRLFLTCGSHGSSCQPTQFECHCGVRSQKPYALSLSLSTHIHMYIHIHTYMIFEPQFHSGTLTGPSQQGSADGLNFLQRCRPRTQDEGA